MFAPEAITAAPAIREPRISLSPRKIFAALLVYFALHVLCRMMASGTVELDESEQVLLAQDWRWGYGVQPPLYTWLQTIFFAVFGQNVLALSLLKHTLLFGTFALTWRTAQEIMPDNEAPLLAMAALLFVPQFAWESHRDLTHSVAATTCGAATLLVTVSLLKRNRPQTYLLWGLLAGLGLLAKYNFAIFLVALVMGIASIPEFRLALTNRWALAAAATFLLIIAGHFNRVMTTGISPGSRELAQGLGDAFARWLRAVLSFGVVLFPLMVWIRWRTPTAPSLDPATHRFLKLIGRTLVLAVVLSLIVVLVWKGRFKDRWFQPVLFALPLYAALWAGSRLSLRAIRTIYATAFAVALVTLAAIPAIPMAASITHRPTRLNLPYATLASTLRASGLIPKAIIADSRLTGGNLKLHFPSATVVVPELPGNPLQSRDALFIWDAAKRDEPPSALLEFAEKAGYLRRDFANARQIECPLQFVPQQKARWAYVVLRNSGPTPSATHLLK